MTFKTARIKWAKKLLGAKYFVVLTDKESAIAFDGADPDSFTDMLALSAQSAEVNMFYEKLGELVKDHDKALKQFMGGSNATSNRKKSSTKSKAGTNRV